MLSKSFTAATVIPIFLILNSLNYILPTDKMPDVFQCDENCVLITLSTIVRRKFYIFYPYNARRYEVVVGPFMHQYSDFHNVNKTEFHAFRTLINHNLRAQ